MTTPTLSTPTGRLLGSWPAGSSEWHAARQTRLGGSDMAAVFGRSPWTSPYRLWHLKAGHVTDGPATAPQERGHYLEDGIRQWWSDQHPQFDVVTGGTYVHHERDYQLANPDGILLRDNTPVGVLEVKTDSQDDDTWGAPGTDEVPLYYRTQILWYLDALGLDVAHVAVLTRNLEFRSYTVSYDPDDAAILRQRAELFLDSLLFNEPPALDEHKSTYQTVRQLHPAIDGTDTELTFEEAATYCSAKNALKVAEERERYERSVLADRMRSAKRARYLGMTIANRQCRGDGDPFVVAGRNLPDIHPHQEIEEDAAA